MVLRECPFCHRPFEAQMLSKEEVDSSEIAKVGDFPLESGYASPGRLMEGGSTVTRGSLLLGLSEEEKKAIAMKPEGFITYKVTYRCKHCAKEWAKLSVEEIPLPREYVAEERED